MSSKNQNVRCAFLIARSIEGDTPVLRECLNHVSDASMLCTVHVRTLPKWSRSSVKSVILLLKTARVHRKLCADLAAKIGLPVEVYRYTPSLILKLQYRVHVSGKITYQSKQQEEAITVKHQRKHKKQGDSDSDSDSKQVQALLARLKRVVADLDAAQKHLTDEESEAVASLASVTPLALAQMKTDFYQRLALATPATLTTRS